MLLGPWKRIGFDRPHKPCLSPRSLLSVLVVTAIVGIAPVIAPLAATIVPRMSFEQIVGASDRIVHGSVVKIWTAWDSEHRAIWTHYELAVTESLKGITSSRLVISEPGGEIAGTVMQVIGVPEYELGDEVVVFTTMTPIGYARTSGWGQGKFDVLSPSNSPIRLVRSSVAGIHLVDPAGRANAVNINSTPIPRLNGLTLDGLKSRIREALRAGVAASLR